MSNPQQNINTNRLLNDCYDLNNKVEQYRKALSKSYINSGMEQNKAVSAIRPKKSQSIFNSGESQFYPNWNINSLGSLSKEFEEMSNKPEIKNWDKENENNLKSNNDNMLININDNSSLSTKSQKYMIANLKQSYDNHINDLYNNFKTCLCKLEEIGNVYNNNTYTNTGGNQETSNNVSNISRPEYFNPNLIKQVLNENLFYERENQIANFIGEISQLKAMKNQEEDELKEKMNEYQETMKYEYENKRKLQEKKSEKLKTENDNLKDNIKQLEEEANKLTDENETFKAEIERLKKVLNVMEIDLNEADRNLMEKTNENEEIKAQYENLQQKLMDSNLKNRSLQEMLEHNETEKNEIIDKLNNISVAEYNSYISDNRGEQQNFNNTMNFNHKKLNDLRLEKDQLNEELTTMAEKYEDSQRNFNKFVKSMQDKENYLKEDWTKKLNKHKEEYENIIINLKKRQQKEIEQLTTEHNIKLEEKEKLIEELKKSVALLKTYEKNYIKIAEHENQLKKALNEQKNKLQKEFDLEKDTYENEYKKKLTKIENDKKMEYEFLTENIKNTLIKLQNENDNYKNLSIQQENKINSLKLERDNGLNIINDKNKLLVEKETEIKSLQNSVKEKEKIYLNLSSEKSKLVEEIASLRSNDQLNKQNEIMLERSRQNYDKLKEQISGYLIENKNLNANINELQKKNDKLNESLNELNIKKQRILMTVKNLKNAIITIKTDYMKSIQNFSAKNEEVLKNVENRILSYDKNSKAYLHQVEQKFEKHMTEQLKINAKLEKENNELTAFKNDSKLQNCNNAYKIDELTNEIKILKNTLEKKTSIINELEEKLTDYEISNKNLKKKLTNATNQLLLNINKLRKKYSSTIFILKTQLNNLSHLHKVEKNLVRMKEYKGNLEKIEEVKNENDNLKEAISELEQKLKMSISDNQIKEAEIKELNSSILIKDEKINNLQSVLNKSLCSYSSGVHNIKMARKLDDDVQILMEKANHMTTISDFGNESKSDSKNDGKSISKKPINGNDFE